MNMSISAKCNEYMHKELQLLEKQTHLKKLVPLKTVLWGFFSLSSSSQNSREPFATKSNQAGQQIKVILCLCFHKMTLESQRASDGVTHLTDDVPAWRNTWRAGSLTSLGHQIGSSWQVVGGRRAGEVLTAVCRKSHRLTDWITGQ